MSLVVKTLSISDERFRQWRGGLTPSPSVGILIAGDRLACCDEAVVGLVDGEIVGCATISPQGEMMNDEPTIVALFVSPDHRRHGYGATIFRTTIERCIEREMEIIRVDVISDHVMRIIANLPAELRARLNVVNCGDIMNIL